MTDPQALAAMTPKQLADRVAEDIGRARYDGPRAPLPHRDYAAEARAALDLLLARLERTETAFREYVEHVSQYRQHSITSCPPHTRQMCPYHTAALAVLAGDTQPAATDEPPAESNCTCMTRFLDVAHVPTCPEYEPHFSRHPKHYCGSCGTKEAAGPGCINCRQTGYDQTPCAKCSAASGPRT